MVPESFHYAVVNGWTKDVVRWIENCQCWDTKKPTLHIDVGALMTSVKRAHDVNHNEGGKPRSADPQLSGIIKLELATRGAGIPAREGGPHPGSPARMGGKVTPASVEPLPGGCQMPDLL